MRRASEHALPACKHLKLRPVTHPRTIAIIDDDASIQEVIRIQLEHKGYSVTIHPDGEWLLAGDFELPELFIIDKQLPGVDGLELCRYLKSRDDAREIPVLILSASPQAGASAMAAGAAAFLEKPFRVQDLRDAVSLLIA